MRYWPAHNVIDGGGRIRHLQVSEGEERTIRQLLEASGKGKEAAR
jgi:hypothetical protein